MIVLESRIKLIDGFVYRKEKEDSNWVIDDVFYFKGFFYMFVYLWSLVN